MVWRRATVPQAVEAAVADVDAVGLAAAEDQGGEGARHAFQCGIGMTLGVQPAVDGLDCRGRDGFSAAEWIRRGVGVEKGAHREFGGDSAALGATDAVGDRRGDIGRVSRAGGAERASGVVFVGVSGAALGCNCDLDGEGFDHDAVG